jgi:hypothetical protein
LDGEIVEVFGFHPRARLDLAETPPTSRQAFEDIGSDQNAVEGECGLEDRRNAEVSYQGSRPLNRLGVPIRPLIDENSTRQEQPCGNAYVSPDREYRTGLGFRPWLGVMPTQPKPFRALEAGDVPRF